MFKIQTLCSLVVLTMLINSIYSARYPEWPWDFRFEVAGNTGSDMCVKIDEIMPIHHFWYDNHFCVKQGPDYKDIGMQFSNSGPIAGKKCILTNEPSASWVWFDNHICFSNDVPYDLQWSFIGCIRDKACISWNEPGSPYSSTWWDDYLCATKTIGNKTYTDTKCAGHMDKGFTWLVIFAIALLTLFIC